MSSVWCGVTPGMGTVLELPLRHPARSGRPDDRWRPGKAGQRVVSADIPGQTFVEVHVRTGPFQCRFKAGRTGRRGLIDGRTRMPAHGDFGGADAAVDPEEVGGQNPHPRPL